MQKHLSERLEGTRLRDGWTVMKKIVPPVGASGSNFSIGYTAKHDNGTIGFLKVLDITKASLAPDPAATLEELTSAFNYERRLLTKCKSLSRVVTALGEGMVRESHVQSEVAQYIIFEFAESDLRQKIHFAQQFDLAVEMRTLHNIAVGVSQLHTKRIAHQDIKPSNVLMFNDGISKVGDLGRSSERGAHAPHDNFKFAGDPSYIPPEYLYHYVPTDWKERRLGCDLYQLGSLIVFMYAGLSATRLLTNFVSFDHSPGRWSGAYVDVLPYLYEYFRLMNERIKPSIPELVREHLSTAISQLCEPDPSRRGHPTNHLVGNRFGLERYVSLFNRLALMARIDMRTKLQ